MLVYRAFRWDVSDGRHSKENDDKRNKNLIYNERIPHYR